MNEKKPHEIVYAVTDIFQNGRQVDSKWVRLGVMFENRDGSHSILVEALPLDWNQCKLVTRHPKPSAQDVEAAENA